MPLRKIILIAGLLALLCISVLTTYYLVKNPKRPTGTKTVTVGVEKPAQVLAPSDLLATPAPSKPSLATGAGEDEIRSKPPGYKLAIPEWKSGPEHVEAAQAATPSANYIKPTWSPVGLDIAFTVDDLNGLYITGTKPESGIRELASDKAIGKQFSWTPDGMSLRAQGETGGYAEFLITGERFPIPDIEPAVFEKENRIYFRNDDGEEKQISGLEDRFEDPVLSPDGLKVVYHGKETGLYIALADGTRAIYVGEGTNAAWMPDSSGIVYDQEVSDGTTIVDGDLWMATVDGKIRTNLTNTPGIVESYPCVAPDGEKIAFSAGGALYVGQLQRK